MWKNKKCGKCGKCGECDECGNVEMWKIWKNENMEMSNCNNLFYCVIEGAHIFHISTFVTFSTFPIRTFAHFQICTLNLVSFLRKNNPGFECLCFLKIHRCIGNYNYNITGC